MIAGRSRWTRTSLADATQRTVKGGVWIVMALLASACGDAGGTYVIEHVRENETPRPAAAVHATSAQRFRGAGAAVNGSSGDSGGAQMGVEFDAPAGWTKAPGAGMRLAGFGIEGQPSVDGSIVRLTGDGGGLADNVNRWRNQVGQDPLSASEVAALERLPVLGLEGVFMEARGSYTGMGQGGTIDDALLLGVIVTLPRVSLYVKVVGSREVLEPRVEEFRQLATSLRLGTASSNPAGSTVPMPPAAPALTWTIPDTWVDNPKGGLRVVNVHPEGAPEAECYVTVLKGDGGGLAENVNRWRNQMELPPLSSGDVLALPRAKILGRDGTLVSLVGNFTGMDGPTSEGQALLGVICELGQQSVFVKMTGPADVLERERSRFEAFCASLKERE